MEAENTLDSTESSKSGATLLEETSVKPSDNNREEEPAAEGPNCNEKENVAESPDENSSREGLERKEMDKEKTVVIPDENVNIVENTTPTVAPDKEHRENVECMETEDTMPSNKKSNNSEELKGPSETCVLSNSNSESLDSDPSKNHLSDKPSQTSDAAEVTRDPNAEEYKDKDKDKGEDSTEKDDEKSEDSDNNDKDVASSSSKDTNNVEKATDATDLNKESNEKTQELENTEFVQISQDKGDDSQMEAPLIDAEDPFGGDTVPLENVEQMETDNLAGTTGTFHKLGDQADNLQDVVKAKETGLTFTHTEEDSVDSSRENENKEPSETTSLASTSETNQEVETVTVPKSGKTVEGEEAGESSKDKTVDKVNPIETSEQEQSSVLPGQDDELCIIPDSMKEIVPAAKSNETGGVSLEAKSKADNVDKSVKDKDVPVTDEESPDANKSQDKEKKADEKDQEKSSSKDSSPVVEVADVINIEDESKSEVEEIVTKEICKQCSEFKSCKIKVKVGQETYNVCSKVCKKAFISSNSKATDIPSDGVNSKREKRCANCLLIVETIDERNLSWETMEFCNEECLGKFQTKYGSYCRNCNGSVQAVSLGKYCVRFGYDVRQFCCSICLEEFKKGLKVCSYCQKDISSGTEGFLAPVGDKGQFKDFCTQDCMEKYSKMSSSEPAIPEKKVCSVCQEEKIVHCEVIVDRSNPVAICSDPCFAAFKFVNKVDPEQCSTCKKFFECPAKKGYVVFYENEAHTFCTKTCLNVFIITNRKIVPCNWCKVKKYNFDMIKKELKTGQVMMMCSLNCLTLYQVSINAVSARRINCDFCKEFSQAQYHLTMSDATIRNFCSYNCVMNFQGQYTKSPITIPASDDPVPTGMPKRTVLPQRVIAGQVLQKPGDKPLEFAKKHMPVISSVTSLATIGNGQVAAAQTTSAVATTVPIQNHQNTQIIYKQQVITRPTSPVKILNRMTQCKPLVHTKGVSVRPHPCTKSTQTDEVKKILIPVPVPIYVPVPMHMYSMPFPVPLPFPLPIPVPIFIPTTRNSAKGIFKEIKRIQEKIPADPFEAELLMMAEMVATEKKANESDSDSADENRDEDSADPGNTHTDGFSEEGVDASNTFGDDMLQMALKMAGELDEQAVDLEAALTPNTITATQPQNQQDSNIENEVQPERLIASRGRKRMAPYKPRSTPSKRGRRVSAANDIPLMPPPEPQPPPQPRILEPMEKPDANMALKYTFGVNAWRQWVIAKNAELEKQITPTRKVKLFKTDLLQLTADELNYSLCLFVKEVRKPNGAEYAPDTIYYLCLGIQQYLFENNRIDNIFTDSYYEKFTECLNEVAKKFSVLYNDAQYIVTRVEEEHLWECKQLGAHSPHVLLSTLMFFNTKHFNLVTVEEHMQLSFSHIMKHWKRNPAAQPAAVAGKAPGSRNVLLRFYPPQSALEGNSRKKKVYEQQENEDNPLRCPVKLYEFYLSKCPESVKTRNDVFYLLPERSCVPDSPVWYSTSPLAKEHLMKMLYRTKMVKEINVSLLTS